MAKASTLIDFAERLVPPDQIKSAGYDGALVYVSELRPGANFDFKPVTREYADALPPRPTGPAPGCAPRHRRRESACRSGDPAHRAGQKPRIGRIGHIRRHDRGIHTEFFAPPRNSAAGTPGCHHRRNQRPLGNWLVRHIAFLPVCSPCETANKNHWRHVSAHRYRRRHAGFGPAVEAIDLVKRFGRNVAVDGVSFAVPRGIVLGLLGPNGAGKTTTVRMMTTLAEPVCRSLYRPLLRPFGPCTGSCAGCRTPGHEAPSPAARGRHQRDTRPHVSHTSIHGRRRRISSGGAGGFR